MTAENGKPEVPPTPPTEPKATKPSKPKLFGSAAPKSASKSAPKGTPRNEFKFTNTPFEDSIDSYRRWGFRQTPRWRYLFVLSMVVTDIVVMLISMVIGFAINPPAYNTVLRTMPIALFIVILCGIWLLALMFAGAYQRHGMAEGYGIYMKIINATIFTIILASCIAFMFDLEMPRTSLIIVPIIAGLIEVVARWLLRRSLHRNRLKGDCKYATVVMGSPEGINKALHTMQDYTALGYAPIAVCPIQVNPHDPNVVMHAQYVPDPTIEGADKLEVVTLNSHFPRTAERLGAQSVLVTDVLTRDSPLLHALSLGVESLGIELAVSVSLADIGGHRLYLRNTTEQPVLSASLPQYRITTYVVKRIMDIILSSIAIVISSPIMLVVAILIKLDDGGPVFFTQTRIGMHGIPFTMYKFRSMVTNAEEIKKKLAEESGQSDRFIFKLKDDPRITKIGKFIRKTSLDEFPQFFNVFKGDMSLVGPRPALPEEVARYNSLYATRLLVKPGITGPWQVSGRSDLSQEQSEYLDVSYIENWSITGDLAILAKTVLVVFKGTGSY
ncbi:sugar transferase [Bifidobacterium simiarum]|uniref:sugar transferase n=1 Tax=Bifidobacterium simiarum TaxID=2045441 RepID=UPI001BDC05D5|nr:sugar transferase [Bifidobacterium simiarum]MBT1166990.1 sugar transferase [Bifidobacterium simiarum]